MKKVFVTSLLVLVLSFIVNYQASAEGYANRLGGADRFEVAVNISKNGWASSQTVILANYNAYADALAAAPLAYKNNAPILLTASNSLNDKSKLEIQRLKASKVIIVGGTASVSDAVVSELRGLGVTVSRIAGKDRFEVANNVANNIGRANKVVVAYGFNFPDALAIAPYAARNGYPILLTKTDEIPSSTKNIINQWNVDQTIIVGGTASISNDVYNSVPRPMRLSGKDRFEVSANIANKYFASQNTAYISTGWNFADALTGSVLAAKKNEPILLTNSNDMPVSIKNTIINRGYVNFTILGGSLSVSNEIYNTLSHGVVGQHIMIDAGHGGTDPGAIGYGLLEKEIVLDVSKRVNSKLWNSLAKVSMTRTGDTKPSLDDRVRMAHESGADIFVSIHVNSYSSSSPNGTETFYNTTYASAESKELAEEIQQELVAALGTYDRGVKQASFYVIKYTEIPSVLVELAFISNPNDAAKLADNTYRQKAADAIYKGIMNFYSK